MGEGVLLLKLADNSNLSIKGLFDQYNCYCFFKVCNFKKSANGLTVINYKP